MAAPARGATTPWADDAAPGLLSGLARLPGQVIVQRQGAADVVALRLVALQPAQVLQDVGLGYGPAEEVALDDIAAAGAQVGLLLLFLR